MILYCGSNVEVKIPKIINSKRTLDFGTGFYLTTDFEQAKKWAILTTERKKVGKPIVTVFEYNESNNLKILKFDGADINWLQFVVKNRKNEYIDNKYDIVIGPVANDNTMPVINLYFAGLFDAQYVLKRLLTQRLKDQVVFKNDDSLKYLKFVEVINL